MTLLADLRRRRAFAREGERYGYAPRTRLGEPRVAVDDSPIRAVWSPDQHVGDAAFRGRRRREPKYLLAEYPASRRVADHNHVFAARADVHAARRVRFSRRLFSAKMKIVVGDARARALAEDRPPLHNDQTSERQRLRDQHRAGLDLHVHAVCEETARSATKRGALRARRRRNRDVAQIKRGGWSAFVFVFVSAISAREPAHERDRCCEERFAEKDEPVAPRRADGGAERDSSRFFLFSRSFVSVRLVGMFFLRRRRPRLRERARRQTRHRGHRGQTRETRLVSAVACGSEKLVVDGRARGFHRLRFDAFRCVRRFERRRVSLFARRKTRRERVEEPFPFPVRGGGGVSLSMSLPLALVRLGVLPALSRALALPKHQAGQSRARLARVSVVPRLCPPRQREREPPQTRRLHERARLAVALHRARRDERLEPTPRRETRAGVGDEGFVVTGT